MKVRMHMHKLKLVNVLPHWFKLREALIVVLLTFIFMFPLTAESIASSTDTIFTVEWLKYNVPLSEQQKFIQKDAEIWTPFLSKFPGYKDKKVWISSENSEDLFIVVRWHSRKEWKAIPENKLIETVEKFESAMGASYTIIESKEFREVG